MKELEFREKILICIVGVMLIAIIALVFLVLNPKETPKLKNGKEIVAQIKGQKYTTEDLYSLMKDKYGAELLVNMIDEYIANKEVKTDEDAESYADSTIDSYKSQYENSGQSWDDVLKNAGYVSEDAFRDDIIIGYKQTQMTKNYIKDNINDQEIDDYYNDSIFGDIKVKHILISPNTKEDMSDEEISAAEDKAKKEAEKIIKKLDDGEDFAKLAKKYSDDEGTASDGGALTASYGNVADEFWEAASELKDKKYTSTPVKTEYGYHIIYRVNQKDKPKLKDVKDDVISKIVEQKMADDSTLTAKALESIRNKYKLVINDSKIKNAYDIALANSLKTTNN